MRASLVILVAACAACTAHAAARPVCPPPVVAPPETKPARPGPIGEAAVIAKSHDFYDAFDRFDVAKVTAALAPTFALYEEARFIDQDALTKGLHNKLDRKAGARSRTWGDEHVFVSGDVAIFVGFATEHVPAEDGGIAHDEEGYDTLVWVPAAGATDWKIAHASWDRRGKDAERERWDDWLTVGTGFSKEPNKLLVDSVKGVKPGTALDVASGQGRNAIFLASQGWKVTGVDISPAGLKLAQDEAARRKLKLTTVESEIEKYDLGTAKWDLVTMIYAGNDLALVERIKPSVKKGGLFVTEYFAFDSDVAKSGAGGWNPKELEAAFKDGWKVLRDDAVEDNADWAGQRKTKLVRFVAQKL